jgi:hypothetical protein
MELAFAGLQQLCAPMLDRLDRLPGPQRDALVALLELPRGLCGPGGRRRRDKRKHDERRPESPPATRATE